MARNLTDCEEGFLTRKRFLVIDRNAIFSPRAECLDQMIFLGRDSLVRAIAEYAAHSYFRTLRAKGDVGSFSDPLEIDEGPLHINGAY